MSRFALTIWAFQITGEATALALVGFFSFAPSIVISPIAGALVDRWNRKLVMMISDLAAGLMTVVVFLLYISGNLEIWHLYVTGFIAALFEPFQWPAFSAAMSTMVPTRSAAAAGVSGPALKSRYCGQVSATTSMPRRCAASISQTLSAQPT